MWKNIFVSFFECFLKVLLDIGNDDMGPCEVMGIPLSVRMSLCDSLLTDRSVRKQVINEFNWEYLDVLQALKSWNVYVTSLSDVEENSIDKE